jgi:hypothetical protein
MFSLASYGRHERNEVVKTKDLPHCRIRLLDHRFLSFAAIDVPDK